MHIRTLTILILAGTMQGAVAEPLPADLPELDRSYVSPEYHDLQDMYGNSYSPSDKLVRPPLGMTAQQVKMQFGSPVMRQAVPSTSPMVTAWVYPTYIVYFQRNKVIKVSKRES